MSATDLRTRLAELRRKVAERAASMPDYPDPPEVVAERDLEREGWLALQAETDAWRSSRS